MSAAAATISGPVFRAVTAAGHMRSSPSRRESFDQVDWQRCVPISAGITLRYSVASKLETSG